MSFIRKFKLEELCLHVIVENLERYIYSQDVPQKHTDFLLRCYSNAIFKRLRSIHRSEDCTLWFLNPHAKMIWLSTVSEKILNRLQVVGPAITSLCLSNSGASEDMINSIICYIPHVTYLNLSYTECSDKTMLCIQRVCSDLVTLNLYQCEKVGDSGMMNLCGNKKNLLVKNLNLIGTDVEYGGLDDILKGMPQLECLKHYDIVDAVTYFYFDIKRSATERIKLNLTELTYEMEGMHCPSSALSSWVSLCPNVKKVHIKSQTTNKVLQLCTKFKDLEDLKIEYYSFDSDDEAYWWFGSLDSEYSEPEDVLAPFIVNANTLRQLSLTDVTISLESLMQCCKNVKNLKLEKVTFSDFVAEAITQEENKLDILHLKSLSLQHSATGRAILHLLSVSKNVTYLRLESIRDTNEETFNIILNSMKNLLHVKIIYISTENSVLVRFLEIPSLRVLKYYSYFDHSDPAVEQYVTQIKPCTLSWKYDSDDSGDSDYEDEDSDCSFDFSDFK